MATVTFTPYKSQNVKIMKDVIGYCCQEKKVLDAESGCRLVSGIDCDSENAFDEFMTTKDCYHNTDGTMFYHYTQSFSPDENITRMEAHEIALEFARQAWPGYEVMVATHCDARHPHSHFIVNSVSYVNGRKLRQPPDTLIKLRKLSDDICQAHKLSVLEPYEGGGAKLSTREYRAAQKMQSWKFRLMSEINSAMKTSGSREEFEAALNSHGYSLVWTDERKYITFTCPGGKRCRDKTLHYNKYLKEFLTYEFNIRKQLTEQYAAEQFSRSAHAGKRRSDDRARTDTLRDSDLRSAEGASGSRDGITGAGGRIPADAERDAFEDSDDRTASILWQSIGGIHGELRATAGEANADKYGANGTGNTTSSVGTDGDSEKIQQPSSGGTDEFLVTGWEPERAEYLRRCQRNAKVHQQRQRDVLRGQTEDTSHRGNNGSDTAGIAAAGIRALAQASDIVEDSSEDPEEKRRRIEAQQNLEAVGYALDVAARFIEERLDEEDEDENFNQDDSGFVPVM